MTDVNRISSEYFKKIGGGFQRSPDRSERDKKIHAFFNLLGLVAGGVAAYVAYRWMSSVWLSVFAFFAVNYFVGRGLGDVVTDSHKFQRFFYFLLPVAIDSGLVYLTYQWWDRMWLAVLVGFFAGAILWAPVAAIVFSRINEQEMEDTRQRTREGLGI